MTDKKRSRREWLVLAGGAAAAATLPPRGFAKPPLGYPRAYERLEAQARKERSVTVYSAADLREMAEVLQGFKRRYPYLRVDYEHMASKAVFDRYVAEIGQGTASADLLFNSAMDLQIKLVNDGYAQSYRSPEEPYLPEWAVWKNQAYGVTAEPIVLAYNKRLMPPGDVPRTHEELEELLTRKAAAYQGKITTYDVERSSTGFLFFTQDEQLSRDTWQLLRAIGRTSPKLYVAGDDMLRRVAAGEHLLAYNVMSSYALEWRARHPDIELIYPQDYTLVMSRIAFISREAKRPAAAKLFLDYLLSKEGQQLLARRYMTPVRSDLRLVTPLGDPRIRRAIHVGPALLANLDRLKHERLLREWRASMYPTKRR